MLFRFVWLRLLLLILMVFGWFLIGDLLISLLFVIVLVILCIFICSLMVWMR